MDGYELVDFEVYLKSTRMRIRFRQLSPKEYEVTGTPAEDGYEPAADVRVAANQAELDRVFGELGLLDFSQTKSAASQGVGNWAANLVNTFLPGLVDTIREANRNPWRRIMQVQEWK